MLYIPGTFALIYHICDGLTRDKVCTYQAEHLFVFVTKLNMHGLLSQNGSVYTGRSLQTVVSTSSNNGT